MKAPDLRKYHHATTLADAGSFARASERLHLSQSALTRSIQALERELGFTLFERSKRGIRPTADGKVVLARARHLLVQADSMEREIKLLQNAELSHIAFGVGPAMPCVFLPELLVRLNRDRPGLSLDVTVDSSADLLELLQEERIELFVADICSLEPLDETRFDTHDLLIAPQAYFVRSGHPLSGLTSVTGNDLVRYTLLTPHYRKQGSYSPEHGCTERSRIFCNDLATLKRMVLETDSILRGLSQMVTDEILAGQVIELTVDNLEYREPGRVALVSRAGRTASAAARYLSEQIENLLH